MKKEIILAIKSDPRGGYFISMIEDGQLIVEVHHKALMETVNIKSILVDYGIPLNGSVQRKSSTHTEIPPEHWQTLLKQIWDLKKRVTDQIKERYVEGKAALSLWALLGFAFNKRTDIKLIAKQKTGKAFNIALTKMIRNYLPTPRLCI